jgi:hypothetical protein
LAVIKKELLNIIEFIGACVVALYNLLGAGGFG